MAQARSYRKKIACLETLWDKDIEKRLDVVPILELASKVNHIDYTYMTCNTKEELRYNLRLIKRKSGYGILYLAFHGGPGELYLDDGSTVDLVTLAEYMGRGFKDWIIHFSTCGSINAPRKQLRDFVKVTNASLLVGYHTNVDWMEGASLDLLLFSWLQSYKNMRNFWTQFKREYIGLIRTTKLRVFHRD